MSFCHPLILFLSFSFFPFFYFSTLLLFLFFRSYFSLSGCAFFTSQHPHFTSFHSSSLFFFFSFPWFLWSCAPFCHFVAFVFSLFFIVSFLPSKESSHLHVFDESLFYGQNPCYKDIKSHYISIITSRSRLVCE